MYQFEILIQTRKLILKLIEELSTDQLNKIPEGFGNNIIWNIGHLAVTQQLLCYKLSGIPMNISDQMVVDFSKDSAPKRAISSKEIETIKTLFLELPKVFKEDYERKKFKIYYPYTTSVNITLTDIDSAFAFSNFHEGIHLGVILALKKLV